MIRRRYIVAGLGFLVVLFVLFLLRPSRPHTALQAYKVSLRAQGEKLTWAELTGSRSPVVHQTIKTVVAAAGELKNSTLTPGSFEFRKGVAPGQARVCWKTAAPTDYGGTHISDWNWIEGEITRAEPQLALMREALREPEPDAGPGLSIFAPKRVDFVALRSASQWLACACVTELHRGRLEEALQNLEALARLAGTHNQEYTLISQMIRVAITGLGLSVTWEALQAPGWTEPQLERMQKAWETINMLHAVENGLVGERAVGAELWALVRGPNARQVWTVFGFSRTNSGVKRLETVVQDYVLLPAYKVTSIDADELLHLESLQSGLETVRSLKAGKPWVEAKVFQDTTISNLQRLGNSRMRIRYWLSSISVPNYSRATETALRNETERQMALAVIALERFRLAHTRLPQDLSELSPGFLARAPHDPVDGKSLRYRPDPNGSFLLYSVGLDGVDDGGNPISITSTNRFGFWDGRDAVWPTPARDSPSSE